MQDELKASGIRPGPGRQAYGCDVPDDLCYQWAADYFNNPNAKEDHEEEEKFVPKPYVGGASQSRSGKQAKEDKKPSAPKKEAEKKPAPPESSGQLSLGGFMMREEKAG